MKLPLDFTLTSAFRFLLPGLLLVVFLSPLLLPAFDVLGLTAHSVSALVVLSIVLGWAVNVLDMTIYMIWEGRRFWPGPAWKFSARLEKRRLKRYTKVIVAYRGKTDDGVVARPAGPCALLG